MRSSLNWNENRRLAALHLDDQRREAGAAVAQLLQIGDPGLIDGNDEIIAANAGGSGDQSMVSAPQSGRRPS